MTFRPPKRSVLLVGNFLSGTLGHSGVCEELAGKLVAKGWSVTTTSAFPSPLRRSTDMAATAWRERGRYEVAMVDVYSGRAFAWAEAACWALRCAGRPYVLVLRGGRLPEFARRWPGRVRRLLSSARHVIAPSRYLQRALAPFRSDIVLVPNPIDTGRYRYRVRGTARPSLVWLRAFHGVYNPSLAARVIARVSVEWPEATLTMVGRDKGDGSLARVRELTAALGVERRVAMPGGVPKELVADWLERGDIFLNTTNVDNTPVSVVEAMATGLCVVSTNVGGMPFLVDEGVDGILVPPDDEVAMSRAVCRVLADPALASRLSSSAREKALGFDWISVLPRIEEILEDAAAGAERSVVAVGIAAGARS